MANGTDLERVCGGDHCDVWLLKRVAKAFRVLDAKKRARLSELMGILAQDGHQYLPPEKFRFEERFRVGGSAGRDVAVYAIKGWQVRLYGSFVVVNGRNAFVGSEMDSSKKQDNADRATLERAARNLAPWL